MYNFDMKEKVDKRGRALQLADDIVDAFLDHYASLEPYWKPSAVPASIMITWLLTKQEKEDTSENRTAAVQSIRQIYPGGIKRYNSKKYEPRLNAFRHKYKNVVVFETNSNLNVTGELMRKIQQRLIKQDNFTVEDLKKVTEVHLAVAKHIESEKRLNRQERIELASDEDSDVSEESIEEASKLLESINS